jgi:hypothetical protein
MMKTLLLAATVSAAALYGTGASAQSGSRIGTLSCDVSSAIGMIIMQKQSMLCRFTPDGGGAPDGYTGQIVDYGVGIGEVSSGHLIWGVIAADRGLPRGALAGTYAGVGAQAAAGAGLGANVLIGGTGRAFSLQPISVEGMTGVNIAGGITTVTLTPAP